MELVSKYPDKLRERAVRMVAEVRPQYPLQWAAITAVAGMVGIGTQRRRAWIQCGSRHRPAAWCDDSDGRGELGAAQEDCGAALGCRAHVRCAV